VKVLQTYKMVSVYWYRYSKLRVSECSSRWRILSSMLVMVGESYMPRKDKYLRRVTAVVMFPLFRI